MQRLQQLFNDLLVALGFKDAPKSPKRSAKAIIAKVRAKKVASKKKKG